MLGVHPVEFVVPFKSSKEATPQAYKMTTRFYPQSLYTGVRC